MTSLMDFLPLLFAAPAIKTGMQGVNYGPQQSTVNQLGRLANAQTNMDNPLFKAIYGQNMQAGQQNLAQSIAEIQRQNRMAISNGQNPLLDQERGGETIFRGLTQGYQDVQNQARNDTFAQLARGSQAYSGLLNPQAALAQGQYSNNVLRSGTTQNIGDALQSLFGLNRQSGGTTVYPSGESIKWNQPAYGSSAGGIGWNGVGF